MEEERRLEILRRKAKDCARWFDQLRGKELEQLRTILKQEDNAVVGEQFSKLPRAYNFGEEQVEGLRELDLQKWYDNLNGNDETQFGQIFMQQADEVTLREKVK